MTDHKCPHCGKDYTVPAASVGQVWSIGGDPYILACIGYNKYAFINLSNGNRWYSTPYETPGRLVQVLISEGVWPTLVAASVGEWALNIYGHRVN